QLGANLGALESTAGSVELSLLDSNCEPISISDAYTLASADNGNPGDATIVGATEDGSADLTAVGKVSFPASIAHQDHVQETVVSLTGATSTLTQVRRGAPGYDE